MVRRCFLFWEGGAVHGARVGRTRHHRSLHRRLEAATQLAQGYRELPYFDHALELLMHETLERHGLGRRPPTDDGAGAIDGAFSGDAGVANRANLALVIQFAEQFPNYVDVIVQCARKTEVERWPDLFQVAGDPVELFEVHIARPPPPP